MVKKISGYKFMFKELVKRDFKQRYKKTVLGMLWSVLSPFLDFLVMRFVFSYIFGRGEHYTTYLFSGVLVFSFFNEATTSGMFSLSANGGILTKINVPKYIFLLSKNVASLINFLLTSILYFVFIFGDGMQFSWHYISLLYPVVCLIIFNIGVGLILSALFVFFKDMQYLYSVFCKLLTYVSAIFYRIDIIPQHLQRLFYINPVFDYITYFRTVTMTNTIPDLRLHILCGGAAAIVFLVGIVVYKINNYKFVFYF